jgi:hypothetical protein
LPIGFAEIYIVTALGLPSGASAAFSPATRTTSGTTTMTITTTGATPLGTYPVTVRATADSDPVIYVDSAPVSLVLSPPAFTLSGTTPAAANAGASPTSTITVTPDAGFTGPVTLSASGLPAGATASFATNPVNTSGTSVMTLATTAATPGGSYPITITGTSGALTRTATVTFTVRSFTLSSAPASQPVSAGGSTPNYVVTLTMVQGYNQTTTFSATGLPAGATASFSPATRTSTGTTNLTIATTLATAAGTHNFNIVATGSGGAPVQSIPATLVVSPGFTVAAAGDITATAGSGGTATINVTASSGLSGATSLSVTAGLPSGATASFSPASVTGTASSILTVSTTAATAGGTYTLTVTGTNGSLTRTVTLTLTVRSFTLSVSPASRTITRGASTTYTLTLTMQGGYNTATPFSATGLPAGTTASFSPASRTSTGTSTVTIQTTASTPRATHTITLNAASGGISKSVNVTLIVN